MAIDAFMGSVLPGSDLVYNLFLHLKHQTRFCVQTDSASIIFNNAGLMNLMRMNSKVINVFWNHALSGEYPEV